MKTVDYEWEIGTSEREHWEERAAIMEFDGGLPRNESEWNAYEEILRARAQMKRSAR